MYVDDWHAVESTSRSLKHSGLCAKPTWLLFPIPPTPSPNGVTTFYALTSVDYALPPPSFALAWAGSMERADTAAAAEHADKKPKKQYTQRESLTAEQLALLMQLGPQCEDAANTLQWTNVKPALSLRHHPALLREDGGPRNNGVLKRMWLKECQRVEVAAAKAAAAAEAAKAAAAAEEEAQVAAELLALGERAWEFEQEVANQQLIQLTTRADAEAFNKKLIRAKTYVKTKRKYKFEPMTLCARVKLPLTQAQLQETVAVLETAFKAAKDSTYFRKAFTYTTKAGKQRTFYATGYDKYNKTLAETVRGCASHSPCPVLSHFHFACTLPTYDAQFSAKMQLKHTMVVKGADLWLLTQCVPNLDVILESSLYRVTGGQRSERYIVHIHVLWQTPDKPLALFPLHTDNSQMGIDDNVQYTFVYNLSDVNTKMNVAGAALPFDYGYGPPGSGSFFPSSLYHDSLPVTQPGFKIAVFVSKESASVTREVPREE